MPHLVTEYYSMQFQRSLTSILKVPHIARFFKPEHIHGISLDDAEEDTFFLWLQTPTFPDLYQTLHQKLPIEKDLPPQWALVFFMIPSSLDYLLSKNYYRRCSLGNPKKFWIITHSKMAA